MSLPYTVAFIGCGNRARAHVPGLLAEERCKLVAVSDVKAEAASSMLTDFKLDVPAYTDHEQMLSKEKPDIVISCLWTPLHLPVFRDCVEAGVKAVMSEKPMAPTWADCKAMVQLADNSGVLLTFCHQRRFSRGNQRVVEMLNRGLFGTVERMDLYSPPNLLDCGTHTIDQAFSFNRETPVKWVLGTLDATAPINWFNVSSESHFFGQIVFENGVRANIQCGGPDMDMWGGVRVIGSEGFVEVMWDGEIKRAVRYADPSWKAPAFDDKSDLFVGRMISDVVGSLESKREPLLSHRRALRNTEVIFALYESVRRHARVSLPLSGVEDNPFITMLQAGEFQRNHGAAAPVATPVPAK